LDLKGRFDHEEPKDNLVGTARIAFAHFAWELEECEAGGREDKKCRENIQFQITGKPLPPIS